MFDYSSRETVWMHPDCALNNALFCKKQKDDFYANDALKFVRGEASGLAPGTEGEDKAKIAKDLIAKNPSLALPKNLQELITAVEREHRVANGWVITLSNGEILI